MQHLSSEDEVKWQGTYHVIATVHHLCSVHEFEFMELAPPLTLS